MTAPFYKKQGTQAGFASYAAPDPIGKTGAPVRALAFSGGLFDTAMQLGVAHALLVSNAEPPDVVVGVSAGAINAVALAEILQAGSDAAHEQERLQAQVARFREVLEAFRESRQEVVSALTPDGYQIDAQRPLVPPDLPIHAVDERNKRARAAASRAGLIDLANDILRVDVRIGAIARAVRATLGLRMAGSFESSWKRKVAYAVEGFRLWRIVAANSGKLAPFVARLVSVTLPPPLSRVLGLGGAKPADDQYVGATAAALIFKARWLRRPFRATARWLVGFGALAPVLFVPFGAIGLVGAVLSAAASWIVYWPATPRYSLEIAGLLGAYLLLVFLLVVWIAKNLDVDKVLASYRIDDGIFDPHVVRSWFVRLFDPDYYGRVPMADIVEAAFTESPPPTAHRTPKVLAAYDHGLPRMHVRPMAANVKTGQLEVIDGDAAVVDALLAATAWPPLFEAQPCGDSWYIDGSAVANEPTRALANHLSRRVNDHALGVEIYPVSPLPLNATELGGPEVIYGGVVDIAKRSLELQAFRDATLDRRMTQLVTRTLPGIHATWWPGRDDGKAPGDKKYLRATIRPIELERFQSINQKILASTTGEQRRALIAEAVANGCRSSLQVMLSRSLAGATTESVQCRAHLTNRVATRGFLPGAGPSASDGPGLPEVCQACVLRADPTSQMPETPVSLRRPNRSPVGAVDWPVIGAALEAPKPPAIVKPSPEQPGATISLLFSGGVFRGVYLAGVINALNEMNISPDVIAGSSIGSITAAMAARIFCEPDRADRTRRIIDVAATYIAVDRLVLTDRFADFIRNFTLRASAAEFSLKDVDTALRAFDRSSSTKFSRKARRVLAGVERLFYISPFEAHDIVRASRLREYDKVVVMLRQYAQEWLERGAVGTELLGAEPLAILIREHVLEGTSGRAADPGAGLVRKLAERNIRFIATMTNLTRGRLDVIHAPPLEHADVGARAIETLLASSAFPAVFRPRWSWEVNPETTAIHQYIDGGVMDNLPLDAVANFLNDRRVKNELVARPVVNGSHVPHLLFTASLEIARERPGSDLETERIAKYWRSTRAHAKQFTYNNKIDNYAETQDSLRAICESDDKAALPYEPLDLTVVAVKPRWLCGTFAFHPMLGFKRKEQAASIAHGCKTTLETLNQLNIDHPTWISAWGIEPPKEFRTSVDRTQKSSGGCWYRGEGVTCPFSRQGLEKADGGKPIQDETRRALMVIYERCGEAATHQAKQTS